MDAARFSSLPVKEQLGHVLAEICRAKSWTEKGETEHARNAIARGLELLSISLDSASDPVWRKEISRYRELLAQFYLSEKHYDVTLEDIERMLTVNALKGK